MAPKDMNEASEAATAAETAFTLELLHVTDQEAAIGALDDAPQLSAVLNALRAEDLGADGVDDNTLVLSSGDVFLPGVFFNASANVFGAPGIADIQIQNELGFGAIALGNHEFDRGTELLAGLIDGSADGDDGFEGTAFPYLSTNLDFSTDPFLAPLVVPDAQAPQPGTVTGSSVIDVNGERIGVIGATTPTLPEISSPGDVTVLPEDFDVNPTPEQIDALAAEIQAGVDALLAANPGIDKVVLLAHMQRINIEQELATRLSDVDIVVAGGSNTRLFDQNDRPREGDSVQGEYPIFLEDADGNPIAVVNTDGSYKYVGRLVIDFENGFIVPESYDLEVSGAYATDEAGVEALDAADLVDPEIQAIVDQLREDINERQSNVLATSEVFLNGQRSGSGEADDPDGVRTQETNLGNLTADANLEYAQEIDPEVVVSIKNGGGIRESIGRLTVPPGGTETERLPTEGIEGVKPEGGISQPDVEAALAFNNGLTLLTLTHQELADAIEHGVSALPDVAGQFPQVAGIEFSFDPTLPPGDRILSAAIVDENGEVLEVLVENGEVVDPSAEARIVTLNFLADGGDGYPFPQDDVGRLDLADDVLTPPEGEATFAPFGTEQDAFAEYLLALDEPVTAEDTGPAEDQRIQNLAYREDSVLDGDGDGDGGPTPGPMTTPIYAIQGASQVAPSVLAASGFATVAQLFDNLPASTSQIVGDTVTTEGIVTAVDSNGFYLQSAVGDGNVATSDAIFVFTGAAPGVAIGDEARVSGDVAEFFPGGTASRNLPTTEIVNTTGITVLSSGNALPEAQIIGQGGRVPPSENIDDDAFVTFNPDEAGIDFFESLEAMLVTVEDAVAVAPTNAFGEIYIVANAGADATGLSERGTLNISPDDFNPERIQIDPDRGVSGFDAPLVGVGAALGDVTGVVGYGFGNFEVIPTEDFTAAIVPSMLEPEMSEITAGGDRLTVASYNVLNLDPNDQDGTEGEAADADVADFRFLTIARQIVENLNTPDIIGLQEIQDNSGGLDDGVVAADETLALLARSIDYADDGRVNGSLEYEFIDNTFIADGESGGQPGGNIRTAFLYNTDRVSLIEDSVGTIGGQGEGEAFAGGRLPLVATFLAGEEEVTIVNNHFSSKGGSAPILGTQQPFEERQEEADVNGSLDERQAQAAAVAEFVSDRLAEDPDQNLIVLGDLNEFEFLSPVEGLEAAGLINLVNTVDEDERYSFIFDGNSQVLDHLLVSEALAQGAEFDFVHVNSEFPADAYRASDHDPLLASVPVEGFNDLIA